MVQPDLRGAHARYGQDGGQAGFPRCLRLAKNLAVKYCSSSVAASSETFPVPGLSPRMILHFTIF